MRSVLSVEGKSRAVRMLVLAGLVVLLAGAGAQAGVVVVRAPAGEEEVRPVAGATVTLWEETEDDAVLLGRWETGDEGRVELPNGPLGRASLLVVTAPGFARRDVEPGGDRERLTVDLDPGLARDLVVVDHRGRPVPRYRWSALPLGRVEDDLRLAVMAAVEADRFGGGGAERQPWGRFALEIEGTAVHEERPLDGATTMRGLEDDEYLLLVGAPGLGVQARRFLAAGEGPVVVRLPDPATCEPVVVPDRETGQPLAGVVPTPLPVIAEGPWKVAWPAWPTGPDGLLPTACPSWVPWVGPSTAILVAEDHAPRFGWEARRDPGGGWVMDAGVVLEGQARDREDEPLAGARVVVTVGGLERSAEVDANGRFRIEGVPRGSAHLQLLDRDGQVLLARELDTRSRDRLRLDLSLGKGLVFRLLREGEPWTGVRVAVLQPGDRNDFRVLATGTPAADGLVRLPVWFGGEEGDEDVPDDLQVAILDDRQVINVPLPGRGLLGWLRSFFTDEEPRELDVSGRTVEGRVLDADTEDPIEGAFLVAYRYGHCLPVIVDRGSPLYVPALRGYFRACKGVYAYTAADDEGRFRLFLPAEEEVLSAEGPPDPYGEEDAAPWADESRRVSELLPGEPVVFRLHRSAAIRVRVVTPDGQLPPTCSVGWQHVAEGPEAASSLSPCRPDGTEIYPPPGVPVLIFAEAADYARVFEGPLALSPGRREEITLTLARPGKIRLEMAEPPTLGGRPWLPPGTLRDAAGRDMLPLATVKGSADLRTVEFSNLPPGKYVVEVGGERRRVTLEEGQEVTIRIGE